jgi:hypothetical protein
MCSMNGAVEWAIPRDCALTCFAYTRWRTLVNGAPLTINADGQSIWQLAGGFAPVQAITDGETATIRDPCVGTVELKDGESLRRP